MDMGLFVALYILYFVYAILEKKRERKTPAQIREELRKKDQLKTERFKRRVEMAAEMKSTMIFWQD